MSWLAKVIEHSKVQLTGCELITFQLRYPRFVHAEFMTHRDFSRNASSSRAIPVAKMIEQVRNNPAEPVHWGKNQAGMQAREELTGKELELAKQHWHAAARNAADIAEGMMEIGTHKQVVNRILEPFQWINVIMSSTEWANWNALRDHEDADPNIQKLARMMRVAAAESVPRIIGTDKTKAHGWHLPYITKAERLRLWSEPHWLTKMSTARCARVSYLTHDGAEPETDKDLDLYRKLVGSTPLHASPTEHPAYGLPDAARCKNFVGFRQLRADIELSFS